MHETAAMTESLPLVSTADLINPLLKLEDVMTADPRTCSAASTVLEAALVMRDVACGVVPVTEGGRPVGMVTDRDIAMTLPGHPDDLARVAVGDIMARDLVTVEREASLDDAMQKLGGEGVRRVLVVDSDGRLAGILSWTDLVPHLFERGVGWVVSRIVENR